MGERMIGGIEQLVDSGPLLLAMPIAAAAGAVTFLSPCCLPLVPGYLSYLTGMSGTTAASQNSTAAQPAAAQPATAPAGARSPAPGTSQATAVGPVPLSTAGSAGTTAITAPGGTQPPPAGPAAPVRGRAVFGTLLFVLGFSAVFALEGAAFGTIGYALHLHALGLTQLLGIVVILLGLMFVGAFDRFAFTGRIFRPQFRPRAGLAGAPVLGVVFALSWTPCIGPTLTAVLTLASTTGGASRAALLAFVYALGLGIPFLIVAFAFQRGVTVFGFARRHARLITQIGGALLIAVGLLEVTGAWGTAIIWLKLHWISGYNAPF
jgi:cytochrome c-type biogenesis protein